MATSTLRHSANKRIYLLVAILLIWAAGIGLRLVYLQIFRYGDFEQRAQHQQQRTTEVAAKRGIIYDRAGRELAMSVAVDSAFAVPADIPDLAGTIALVARITKADPRELLAKCQSARTFCWVARKADAETADRIRAMNLRGIYFQKESKRFYPKRDLAAQVLGYVGIDDEGLSGIEREFDDKLKGEPGRMIISVDAHKKWFGSVEKQPEAGPERCSDHRRKNPVHCRTRTERRRCSRPTPKPARWLWRIRTPAKFWRWPIDPTFNPNLSREITPHAEKPCGKRHLRTGIDIQTGDHGRRTRRETHPSQRSIRLPNGIDRRQRHAHS